MKWWWWLAAFGVLLLATYYALVGAWLDAVISGAIVLGIMAWKWRRED